MSYGNRVLDVLGLDEQEERVYRFLLENPAVGATKIAKGLGATRKPVEVALEGLEQKGFVQRSAGDASSFIPVPPEAAAEGPLRAHAQRLEAARREVVELTERFHAASHHAHPADIVEVLTGMPATHERWNLVGRSARSEVLTFDRPPYAYHSTHAVHSLWEPVSSRILAERQALEAPGRLDQLLEARATGTTVRVTKTLPMKLLVADRRVAVVPIASGDEIVGCLTIRESPLLEALVALFESFWAQATPFQQDASRDESGGLLSDEVERIFELLAAGLTDRAIARALGVSPSTLARRMRDLTESVGAGSRFQLCYLAIAKGLIAPPSNGGAQ